MYYFQVVTHQLQHKREYLIAGNISSKILHTGLSFITVSFININIFTTEIKWQLFQGGERCSSRDSDLCQLPIKEFL